MHRAPLLLFAGLLACHAAPADDDSGADGSSGSTGEPIPSPDFLNPAVGSFRIDANQTDAELLVVQDIVPGLTQVLLDGDSLGTLPAGSPLGQLDLESLSLTVHGALAIGKHTLQLLTISPDAPLYSVELELNIESPDPKTRPTFSATLSPDPIASGQRLFAAGVGANSLLGLVSPGDPDPELHLFTADAEHGWTTKPIVVPLTRHVLLDMSFAPAVSPPSCPKRSVARPGACASPTTSACPPARSPPATSTSTPTRSCAHRSRRSTSTPPSAPPRSSGPRSAARSSSATP